MKNIDFPINMKICVRPGLDKTSLPQLGYRDYRFGVSRFNNSLIGWGGHTNESEALMTSAKHVLDIARTNGIKHLQSVYGMTALGDFVIYNLTDLNLTRQNSLSACHILNMNEFKKLTKKDINWIGLGFDEESNTNNLSVVIQFEGATLASHRQIQNHKFYHSGDVIDGLSSGSEYIVKIKKNIFVEEDPGNTCRNYPNEDFASYKECDDKVMADTLKNMGLNITPPWLTDNLDDVTVTPVQSCEMSQIWT